MEYKEIYGDIFDRIDVYRAGKPTARRLVAFAHEGRIAFVWAGEERVYALPDLSAMQAMVCTGPEEGRPFWDDLSVRQSYVVANFVDRDMLSKADYAAIKACGKSYRGRGAWPSLRAQRPFCVPMQPSFAEVLLLAKGLDALKVCTDAVDDDGVSYVDENGKYAGKIQPDLAPRQMLLPVEKWQDELLAARIKRLPVKRTAWDVTVQAFPFPSRDEQDENMLVLPVMLMIVDEESDMVMDLVQQDHRDPACATKLTQALLMAVVKFGHRPSAIKCATENALHILSEATKLMGIPARPDTNVPQLEEAFFSLLNFAAERYEE